MSSQAYTKEYLDSVYVTFEDMAAMKQKFFQGCNDVINMSSYDDYDAQKITEVFKAGFDLKDRFSEMRTEVVSMFYTMLRTEAGLTFLSQHKKFAEIAVTKAHEMIVSAYRRPDDKQAQEARKIMQSFLYEAHEIIMHHENDDGKEIPELEYFENYKYEDDDSEERDIVYHEDDDVDADEFDERIRNNHDDDEDDEDDDDDY